MKTISINLWPWFQESGGMMTLTDIYCRVNRARGLEVNCFFPFSILARTGAGMSGSSVYSRTDRLIDFWCLTLNQPWRSYQGEIIFIKSEGKVWLPFYGMHSYIYLERLGKKWSWMNWEGRHLKHSISISMSEKFKALDSQQIKFLHPWYPDTRKCTMYARISDYSSCSRFQ